MAKLTETVSAVTPLGDALREPAKAPRKRRASTVPEPLGVAWSCPCHGTRFDDLREIYLHIRAELQARDDARDAGGRRRIAKCGTTGGYQAHRSKGEKTCDLCRAALAAYRAANLERFRAHGREYHARHRDAVNAKSRMRVAAYYATNRDEINAVRRARRKANKDAINAAARARRAARREATK